MSSEELEGIRWECPGFPALESELLYKVLRLRQDIFVIEQACIYPDIDNLDQVARHVCGLRGDTLLAYLRSLPPGTVCPESALGRVAVSAEARGKGLGRELVQRGIDHNLERWPGAGIRISAQAYLEDFYIDMGFATDSDEYDEDGIPHIQMIYKETP